MASLPASAAFLPSFGTSGVPVSRPDSKPWRLEYFDDQAQQMQIYSDPFVYKTDAELYPPVTEASEDDENVDIPSFESEYQGLTNPSKAGLALAVVIGAAMVAASPEMDYSSLVVPGLSASWLGSVQHDLGPIFQERLPLISTSLAQKAGEVWREAGMKEADLLTQAAIATNKLQMTVAENAGRLQGNADDIASFTSSKAEAMKASAQELQDSFVRTESGLFAQGMAMAESLRETIATKAQQFQSMWGESVEQVKISFFDPMASKLTETKASFDTWQTNADEVMLREGEVIRDNMAAALDAKRIEMENNIVVPAQEVWTRLQDSFIAEVARENSIAQSKLIEVESFLRDQRSDFEQWNTVLQSSVPEQLFRNYDVLISKVTEVRESVVPGIALSVERLSEWALQNTVDVLTKAESLPAKMMDAAEFHTGKSLAFITSQLSHLSFRVESNLKEWQTFTDAQILEGKAEFVKRLTAASVELEEILQTVLLQVTLLSQSLSAQVSTARAALETYQGETNLKLMDEGSILKDNFLREWSVVDGFVCAKMAAAQNAFIDPVLVANYDFWISFESGMKQDMTAAREGFESTVSIAQSSLASKVTALDETVMPEIMRRTGEFYDDSKASVLEASAQAHALVTKKAAEVQPVNIAATEEAIKSWSVATREVISSMSNKVYSGIAAFCRLLEDSMATKYVAFQNDVLPTVAGSAKDFADHAEDLFKRDLESAQNVATAVFDNGNQIKGDLLSKANDLLSSAPTHPSSSTPVPTSVAEPGESLARQTTPTAASSTTATLSEQYDRLQKNLFDGFS
eukprot:CAMPEP_0176024168 /NCGR_PEP_ID=MMETSP0120_2-20121206/11806_1 /TAXON_ID=160619 /ORGANISM="Kryptoperidinium foliaceum, Strain CCMP 1326" /LENGTH=804 /DNA_ID=CAMNT_0017357345 /DNA_START=39 /DNA_END=2453 /DNA_ORIENTATION=-